MILMKKKKSFQYNRRHLNKMACFYQHRAMNLSDEQNRFQIHKNPGGFIQTSQIKCKTFNYSVASRSPQVKVHKSRALCTNIKLVFLEEEAIGGDIAFDNKMAWIPPSLRYYNLASLPFYTL